MSNNQKVKTVLSGSAEIAARRESRPTNGKYSINLNSRLVRVMLIVLRG
jgi:hypothetical protein